MSSTTQPTAPANAVGPWYPGLTTQPARSSFFSFGLWVVVKRDSVRRVWASLRRSIVSQSLASRSA